MKSVRDLREPLREEAGCNFDNAGTVSVDLGTADYVVVVSNDRSARVYLASAFSGSGAVRACLWCNLGVQSLLVAAQQVAARQISSVLVSTVAVSPRITLCDSTWKPVTGTLRSPQADYLVISEELLSGLVPEGGVLLADHLVALIERD